MADNLTSPVGNGTNFATDEIGGVHFPRTKLSVGADGSATDVHAGNPLPVTSGTLPAGTNRSGTITSGGTQQSLAPANSARVGLYIQNISNGDLWVNELGTNAAVGTAGSWLLGAGDGFSVSTNRAISIVGATTGQAFTALEF